MAETFCCPITLEIMTDPVCDKEGNSFERTAIVEWITLHGCSPITRTPMLLSDLVPNRALKDMIVEHGETSKQSQSTEVAINSTQSLQQNKTQPTEPDRIKLHTFVENSKMLITVDSGDSEIRTCLAISCVIDVSGSMAEAASLPGENSQRESFGLTILDIVKHAVTTVIKSLNSNDILAITTFTNTAELLFPPTRMDQNGQRMAMTALNNLCPMGGTNLWAGLESGLNVLNLLIDNNANNRLSTVMLFTDGEPNIIPPRGHLPMLQMYKDRLGELPGSINTFGFGYTLDSKLLNDLAMEGEGSYSFIPDSGFVGTIFVHAIANLKVTIAKSCRLTVELLNGATFVNPVDDLGQYLTCQETWGITVDIGSIQTGQTKDIVLEVNNLPTEGTTFAAITLNAKTRTCDAYKLSLECNAYQSNDRIPPTHFRFKFIHVVKNAMKLMAEGNDLEAHGVVQNLIVEMQNSCTDPHSLALLQDIQGQVVEGLRRDYYQKWGRHYLPSLLCAHLYQVCNNFKDIGPQVYGGTLFKTLRDEADALFCSLPPPKPCVTPQPNGNVSYAMVPNMRMFHNSRGVCFHGKGLVRMFDGLTKNVESITKGDQILSINGAPATISCVVETKISEKRVELVECPNGLLITPWHPIRFEPSQNWIFPISLAKPEFVPCQSVFNFVLNEHHVINVNGIDCVTLGHSFTDSVCAHKYFGTVKVINDLKAMRGYSNGLIKLIGVHRDPCSSYVIGLIEE